MDNKNQPAFPVPCTSNENGIYSTIDAPGGADLGGLTKREWMSGMAMQALISKTHPDGMTVQEFEAVIEDSVRIADALLAKLSK